MYPWIARLIGPDGYDCSAILVIRIFAIHINDQKIIECLAGVGGSGN